MADHVYLRCLAPEPCGGCKDNGLDCMYASLAICSVCGGIEGSLLPECPGHQLSELEHEANYQHYCRGTGPFEGKGPLGVGYDPRR